MQVKYAASNGRAVEVCCRSQSITAGRVVRVVPYTADTIDWLAVYDATTDRCFYVPAAELGTGRRSITLRLTPPSYNRRKDVRFADDYAAPEPPAS